MDNITEMDEVIYAGKLIYNRIGVPQRNLDREWG